MRAESYRFLQPPRIYLVEFSLGTSPFVVDTTSIRKYWFPRRSGDLPNVILILDLLTLELNSLTFMKGWEWRIAALFEDKWWDGTLVSRTGKNLRGRWGVADHRQKQSKEVADCGP